MAQDGLGYLTVALDGLSVRAPHAPAALQAELLLSLAAPPAGEEEAPPVVRRRVRTALAWDEAACLYAAHLGQSLELRARRGWLVTLSVSLLDAQGQQGGLLSTSAIAVDGAEGAVAHPLFAQHSADASGSVSLCIEHTANHQSFEYILQVSAIDAQLTHLRDIQTLIRSSAIDRRFIDEERALLAAVDEVLSDKHEQHALSGALLQLARLPQTPLCVEAYRAVMLSKKFLHHLLGLVLLAPAPSTVLIQQQLDLLTRDADAAVPWASLLLFVRAQCIWYLQQAAIGLVLVSSYASELDCSELIALRDKFTVYDVSLNGEMPASDLFMLLQDLRGEYSPKELAWIRDCLDADGLNVIEFSEFVRWWIAVD